MKAAIASVGVSRRGEPPSGPLTSRALPRAPGHAGAPRGRSARSQRLVTRRTGRSASGSRSRFRQSAPRPPTVAGRPQGHADHLQDRPRPGRGHLRGRRGLLLHDHEREHRQGGRARRVRRRRGGDQRQEGQDPGLLRAQELGQGDQH